MLSRRSLLAGIASVVASQARAARPKSVAIVGAGIAGIAAARRLSDAGWSVTVFEARDRIGGRIFTDTHFGFPAEIGANWIHGDRRNPLVPLARDAEMTSFAFDFDDWRIIDAAGRPSGDRRQWEAASEALADALDDATDDENLDMPLSTALARDRRFSTLEGSHRPAVSAVLRREVAGEYGADPAELSAAADLFGDAYSGEDLLITNGYDRIVSLLSRGLPIRLRTPVTAIRHGRDGVLVVTASGEEQFDAAVVAVPLGVLKAGAVAFDPPLSTRRTSAIRRIGFNAFEKAFLLLDRPFDLGALNASVGGDNPWCNLIDLSAVAGRPAVLAYCGGSDARKAVAADDAQNRAWLLGNCRLAAGDLSIAATGFAMSRWQSDPHALGSYSFPAVGAHPDDHDALGGREGPSLHFAGEACSAYPGTVHGAYLSGLAAAKSLLAS